MRALVSVLATLLVLLLLPHSRLLEPVSHWCLETVLPLVGLSVQLHGHHLGDAATLIPTLVVGASLLAVIFGVARATRAIGRLVGRALGTGPRNSVIVGGAEVVLASAGLAHPRILVSAGALLELEDDELEAGLAHEQGHIAHRHRFVLLFAEICRGLARFLPGTQAACRALIFQLERDADRWALAQRHEPVALARAICKSGAGFSAGPAYVSLSGDHVPQRIAQILEPPRVETATSAPTAALAAAMVAITLSMLAWAPTTALAGVATFAKDHPIQQCDG